MKPAKKFYNFFVFSLSKNTRIDGRLFVLILLTIYLSLIVIPRVLTKSYEFWSYFGVPARPRPFGDMQVITSGFECHRLGYDVIVENPCNPWPVFSQVNYPRIWMALAPLGLDQSHTIFIGIFFALMFFLMVFLIIRRLNYSEALIYSIVLCSPSVMLGVERGNNDLIIFIILSIYLVIMNTQKRSWRFLSYSAILFAAILKLYPIFAFTVLLKEKKKDVCIVASFIAGAFIIYVLSTLEALKLISAVTPRATFWSYGCRIIFSIFSNDLKKILEPIGFDKSVLYNLLLILNSPQFIYSLILVVIIKILTRQSRSGVTNSLAIQDKNLLEGFRLGASIYIGTFLIGNNWAYRLIFLIFTIPQILSWIKGNSRFSLLSSFSLIGIVLTLWLKTISQGPYRYFEQLIDWLLFFYFIYGLLLTLPDWLKAAFRSHVLHLPMFFWLRKS